MAEIIEKQKFDYGFVFYKVGDKEAVDGIKDGMVADIRNPNLHDCNFSDWEKKVYCIKKVPLAKIIELENFDFDSIKDIKGFKAREYIVFDELQTETGIKDLVKDLRSSKVVDIVDCTQLPDIDKDIKDYPDKEAIIIDKNAVTSGSYTYGSGGSYSTRALAYADIGNLTGNLTFTAISAITETSVSQFSENLGGYLLTDNLGGYTSSTNYNGSSILCVGSNGSFRITNGTIKVIYNLTVSYGTIALTTAASGINWQVDNLIIDGDSQNGRIGLYFNDANCTLNAYNIIAYDMQIAGVKMDVVGTGAIVIENCIADNCVTGFGCDDYAFSLKNCVGINNTTADFAQTASLATFTSCASEDATGSAVGVQSITPSNEFISTTFGNADYLKPLDTPIIGNGGVSPSIVANTSGLGGNARPHTTITTDKYSIGAYELAGYIVPSTGENQRIDIGIGIGI